MIDKIQKGIVYFYNLGKILCMPTKETSVKKDFILFDTSLESENLGDQIINDYGKKILEEIGINIIDQIPTHKKPTKKEQEKLKQNLPKLILGTNIGSSHMNIDGVWKKPNNPKLMENLCLLGIGWDTYSDECNLYTKLFYKKLLNSTFIHSVRDSYSEQKLKKIGIENVINTSCPSMWRLTPEFCKKIPKKKAKNVITTITDYDMDIDNDFYMLDKLVQYYDNVYLWLQGRNDYDCIKRYRGINKLKIIDATLEAYDECLRHQNIEFIGTRLHAGIRALNFGKRTLIIGIDNRALEIAKDTNLPVIKRSQIRNKLKYEILCNRTTNINIPQESINKWKEQFKR